MSKKRASSGRRNLTRGRAGKGESPQRVPRKPPKLMRPDPHEKLLARLKAAEETLRAIRSGEVDALMVAGRHGERVVTLKGGEPAYRMLVDAMSEGAATLSRDGSVLYSNRKFAELIRRPVAKVVGIAVPSLIEETERDRFEMVLAAARKGIAKGEFKLHSSDGSLVPVHLSLNKFEGSAGHALGMVIVDLSEQKRKQAEELKQAEARQRLLLERVLSGQEEERRRIARELHDEAGQLLTSLLVGLRGLEDSGNIAIAKAEGQRLRKITARAIDEIGRLARGLHPVALDDHGLGVALRRYVTEYAKTYKIAVNLRLSAVDNVPPAVQIGVYRILQEALTNVARHSGAKSVSILFARSATVLKVRLTDDGHGFDATAPSSHLGIHSMRERAVMLGGTVHFTSEGKGTRVLVQIPLTHPDVPPFVGRKSN